MIGFDTGRLGADRFCVVVLARACALHLLASIH